MVQSSGANESKMEKHILWDFLLLLLFAGTNQVKNHMFGRSEEEPPAGRRKALSFLFDRVSSVTWEVKERKEAGGEKRETKTNREGKIEREGEWEGGRFSVLPAPARLLSLAALTPQLLLVQSTVTGREPAAVPAKNTHTAATAAAAAQAETQRSGAEQSREEPNVFGTDGSLRLQHGVA